MNIFFTGNGNEKRAPGLCKRMEPMYGKRAFDRGFLPSCEPDQVPCVARSLHLQLPALQPLYYEEKEGLSEPANIT
jgi:hypothetical protein